MEAKPSIYIPAVFNNFPGFKVKDIKEWRNEKRMEIILDKVEGKKHYCAVCHSELGAYHDGYWITAKHCRMMDWVVEITFFREKRECKSCNGKTRSEEINFVCPESPHITMELAWWVNRLTEITSVLRVSHLESIDKKACYRVDKHILARLLHGYKIPKVTQLSVDEVYARGNIQLREGETRDDLFLTVIIDIKTHKVIWVTISRRKEALDEFFNLIGPEQCRQIEVVATDQHAGYGASVKEHCPNATLVWDRFHLTQKFNDALNLDRRDELQNVDPEGEMQDLMNNKYRFLFLKRAYKRTAEDKKHIDEVMRLNQKITKMEIIKERFHQVFNCNSRVEAEVVMAEVYQWAFDANAVNIFMWIKQIREEETFWNYFKFKVTTGISEGINRLIKGIKWQAYGYKDMFYFKLKILQKAGYLNSTMYLQLT
jgi:transposase